MKIMACFDLTSEVNLQMMMDEIEDFSPTLQIL
jgi:hypothetical protein